MTATSTGDLIEIRSATWTFDKPHYHKNPMTIKQLPRGTVAVVVEVLEEERMGNMRRSLHILQGGELMWIASELACPLTEEGIDDYHSAAACP